MTLAQWWPAAVICWYIMWVSIQTFVSQEVTATFAIAFSRDMDGEGSCVGALSCKVNTIIMEVGTHGNGLTPDRTHYLMVGLPEQDHPRTAKSN